MRNSEFGMRNRSTRCPSARSGFTLLEILVVLALLVALMMLAWPLMANRLTASELPESADRVRSMLSMVRSSAMMEHRRHRIRFEPGVQHPFIEYEPDPIFRPGFYEPVRLRALQEDALLGEVQIHEVRLGRPDYLTPVAGAEVQEEAAPNTAADITVEMEGVDEAEAQAEAVAEAAPAAQENADPNRPTMVFEVDGSSEWATVIVARLAPGEPISEEVNQLWVVLDGRTGLATVREQVTDAQLADAGTYVSRDKLEPPQEADAKSMIEAQTAPMSGAPIDVSGLASGEGMAANPQQQNPQTPAQGTPLTGSQAGQFPNGQQPLQPSQLLDPNQPLPGQDGTKTPDQPEQPNNVMDELEKKLQDSDLSEEEKQRIRDSFQKDHEKQDQQHPE